MLEKLKKLVRNGYEGDTKPESKVAYKEGRCSHNNNGLGHYKGGKVNDRKVVKGNVGVLPPHPPRDTPEVVSFLVGCHRDQELESVRNTKFRKVQSTESVIPYILCGLYCLRW
jgi:hypothetical protein